MTEDRQQKRVSRRASLCSRAGAPFSVLRERSEYIRSSYD